TTGDADIGFAFGNDGDVPVAGDWDGDGVSSVGVYRPSNGTFYLRNHNWAGAAEVTARFGNLGDKPVVGDWDGDGDTTISVYRPGNGTFYLRNANSAG